MSYYQLLKKDSAGCSFLHYGKMFDNKGVLKVASPKCLVVIIRRCQRCIEHAGQQFEQFL
jgi:predicted RNA-binding Zn-ribbon protein involved in translation (DUF1610 family)